ncbi:acyl-CoA dehydrogenases [Thiohalobacter thiocyanaticus]|uniref:Acyl-coenzyme A dehydrogenase n=1 Tax=Thiohalobacter thiocyanaticus TaxID=585455 RepID=A0A1Z4VS53_9GAMM|nr:acyl-CoA dehydrogenase [Thiohalobacter thiocyanaticus]BAZ94242.1 acyl-CoA dehydrogenases [Thiohalobacter thiocyanaticus]
MQGTMLWILAAALIGLALLTGLPDWRRRLLMRPLFRTFKRVLPPLSQTEREALEAGTVGWDGELFSGRPDWNALHRYPVSELSEHEQAFLDGPVEDLCRQLDDWRITHEDADLAPEVWDFIKQQGFFGMIIPRQYGGLEFSAQAHSRVVMKIASRSLTAAVTVMVPNSLGPAKLLLHYGTAEQKDHYLPRLARGEEVPCFALTGPEAGSDAASLPDTGVVCFGELDGERVLGIRLNWDKRYITLGPVATLLGLAFHLYDPDGHLGSEPDLGITLALIPTDAPGVEIGRRHYPLNSAFQNGPNRGHDVFIPIDQVIGGRDGLGQGWRMLMECLADGRSISLPALATGAGKLCSRATGAYAAVRRQFRQPIGRFEGVAEALARIGGNTYLMEAARDFTCSTLDNGEQPAVVSAIVKYHLTERMRETVNHAMDIHGGSGICLGPRNLLGRVYQAVPISITVEGANILTRSMIIFGQGALRSHPYVLRELEAVQDPDAEAGLLAFDRALTAHLRWGLGNAVRCLWYGLTGARLQRLGFRPRGEPVVAYRQLTRLSTAFALSADLAMFTLGGSLKRRERLSARLGDVLSNLYLGSAALKQFHDQGCPEADRPLVEWAWRECAHRAQEALLALCDNLPNRWLGRLLRLWLFPLGRSYAPPSDALCDQVVELLLRPGEARDRLTAGLFLPESPDATLNRLETALTLSVQAEPVLRRIRAAMQAGRVDSGDPEQRLEAALAAGVITAADADRVRAAVAARHEVIAVDAFDPADLGHNPDRIRTPIPTTQAEAG